MKKRILAMMLVLALTVTGVFAFQFSPLEQSFEPTGANSAKTYTIVNDSDDSIAIEISALTRDQDATGTEVNTSASAYFSIVPAKVIVLPQSTKVVRVQYRGPATVTSEMAFRLRAEQIPYSQGKQQTSQSMFNFLYVYSTSLYVTPSQSVVKVDLGGVSARTAEDGTKYMDITLQNKGNVHQILVGAEITIADAQGNRIILSGSDMLPGIDGMNLLARKKVVKSVPWPESMPFPEDGKGSYQAIINYSN